MVDGAQVCGVDNEEFEVDDGMRKPLLAPRGLGTLIQILALSRFKNRFYLQAVGQ